MFFINIQIKKTGHFIDSKSPFMIERDIVKVVAVQ